MYSAFKAADHVPYDTTSYYLDGFCDRDGVIKLNKLGIELEALKLYVFNTQNRCLNEVAKFTGIFLLNANNA